MDPLASLREQFWFNIWEPKTANPKAPIVTLVLKEKQGSTQTKYPVWRDKEGRLYLGKPELVQPKDNQETVSDLDDQAPPF